MVARKQKRMEDGEIKEKKMRRIIGTKMKMDGSKEIREKGL